MSCEPSTSLKPCAQAKHDSKADRQMESKIRFTVYRLQVDLPECDSEILPPDD